MMARMEQADIQHLGLLARIDVTLEEQAKLQTDIESVLEYVGVISSLEIPIDKTVPAAGVRNVFREDTVTNEPGAHRETLLKEAPKTKDGFVVVPKILNPDA